MRFGHGFAWRQVPHLNVLFFVKQTPPRNSESSTSNKTTNFSIGHDNIGSAGLLTLLTPFAPWGPGAYAIDDTPPTRLTLVCLLLLLLTVTTFCISVLLSLFEVSLRLPLFLFPCGFQVKACLLMLAGFLSVLPIQPHFLLRICETNVFDLVFSVDAYLAYLVWPVDADNFAQTAVDESLELMGAAKVIHVPDSYRNTDFTLLLDILSLVDLPISLQLQTLLRIRKAVCSSLIPLRLARPVCQPHFLNEKRASRGCLANVTRLLLTCSVIMIFVLSLLMWRPALANVEFSFVLHLCVAVEQECQVISKVKIIKL